MALVATGDETDEIISCPFTWKLENAVQNLNKLSDSKDDRYEMVVDMQDHFPEFVLIYHLLMAYEHTMRNDLLDAMRSIMEAEKSLSGIKQKSTLKSVERVLDHIFVATKCNVLMKHEDPSEVKRLMREICEVEDMNETELAMLNGCICLAWGLYYETNNLLAINHAKKAVELEPYNGKWYYLLGKNYRRLRRMHQALFLPPNEDETSAFVEAYRLSKNPLFGVSLATLYRESRNPEKATEMYEEVYALQPTSLSVRLQSALGFIRANKKTEAERCLDYVGERAPDANMYTHYMGIYHQKFGRNLKFQTALPYYERSTEKLNYGAEWQYINCKKQVDRGWDPLPYMLELLNKYEKGSDHVIQQIHIGIGWYYLFDMKDVLPACPHLTKAIEIRPDSQQLKNPYSLFGNHKPGNIYKVLAKEVRSALKNHAAAYDNDTITMLRNALQLCEDHHQA